MVTISNLRVEQHESKARLVCDIDCSWCTEKTIWYEVETKYEDYFSTNTYDAFLVALLYPAMFYNDDIVIKGNVSKKMYKNIITYVEAIIEAFSKDEHKINITVDGFCIAQKKRELIATGFSGGVDSFSTFYDHYEKEDDADYKINTLFFQNTGTHGKYSNPESYSRFNARYNFLKAFPLEKNIPYIWVNTNVHAFIDEWNSHQLAGPTAMLSVILAFEASVKKYYWSSALSYYNEKYFGRDSISFDLFEFSETYLLPLLSTEICELVSDGCQRSRSGKTNVIKDYKYAHKYLNVCVNGSVTNEKNCSYCDKCMRTLIALESVGCLEKFSNVFDISVYKKHAFKYKCRLRTQYNKDAFATDNVNFAKQNGNKIPCLFVAYLVMFPIYFYRVLVKLLRFVLPTKCFQSIKYFVFHK